MQYQLHDNDNDFYKNEGRKFLSDLWKDFSGVPVYDVPKNLSSPAILRKTEISREFECLRVNRKVQGAFRYGLFSAAGKPQFDRMNRIILEATEYVIDGNDERLLDITNMCELEFIEGIHPKKHFKSNDDTIHNKIVKG